MAEGEFEAEVRAALREAVSLFNDGRFRESHEVLEKVWLRDGSPRRRFLQGLIKVAAGYHHLGRANYAGMESLLTAGRKLLVPFGAQYMGVDLEGLVNVAARHAEWARRARAAPTPLKPPDPPILKLSPEPAASHKAGKM